MTIDDERVITLLHDAVPAVPDLPDRVDAIRRRAGRQRAQVWTQTIAAVAAVVVLVGLASAVAAPRGGTVRPAADPLKDLAATFAAQRSVQFEITTKPVGTVAGTSRLPAHVATDLLTSHATGAVARNGDFHVDGDLSALAVLGESPAPPDAHIVSVGGSVYLPVSMTGLPITSGKKWIREQLPPFSPADIERVIRLGLAFTDDVRYTGSGVVRDTRVAEYALTLPARYAGGEALTIEFALDREGRPRRIATDINLMRLFGGVADDSDAAAAEQALPEYRVHLQLDLFGYGSAVTVTAPPAAEVLDEGDIGEQFHESVCATEEPSATQPPDMSVCEHVVAPVPVQCSPAPTPPSGYAADCTQTGYGLMTAPPPPYGSQGSGWSGYGGSGTDSATLEPTPRMSPTP